MSKRTILLAISVVIFVPVACVFDVLYIGYYRYIASYSLGNGYSLEVWSEQPALSDPRLDLGDPPGVYYQIKRFGAVVVPQTFISIEFMYKPDMRIAFAERGILVCVYDAKQSFTGDRVFIIWDSASGESWPRLRDNERPNDPIVVRKWTERYNRLKAANPNLPPF